ncbi:MAG: DUF2784 domain-containing protein [Acidobacteria bacterium]|nr:DUF2784 domain-containing protein [Acidobacteriota bacterium]
MGPRFYQILAAAVFTTHFAWILWVIFGCLLTRARRILAGLHIFSLVYGILIEILLWPCPLTIAENWLQARAGITPYQEGFLVHYLKALIYPEVSQTLLTWVASAVCLFNLGVYGLRLRSQITSRRT